MEKETMVLALVILLVVGIAFQAYQLNVLNYRMGLLTGARGTAGAVAGGPVLSVASAGSGNTLPTQQGGC